MRTKQLLTLTALVAVVSVGVAVACSDTAAPPVSKAGTFYGTAASFAQGSARAWVTTDASGAPTAMGVVMTAASLQGLPTTSPPGPNPMALMVTLPLPEQAKGIGFDHAELGWNPTGHAPVHIYDVPHFDLHFYMIDGAAEAAILPSDPQFAAKAGNFPTGAFVPTGYHAPPGTPADNVIPQMGVHWVDATSPEFNGQPFTKTFIFGSWDGRFIFVEPMIAKAYLETLPNAEQAIPQPATWPTAGRFPTTYAVNYDATAKEYRFTLGGLTQH